MNHPLHSNTWTLARLRISRQNGTAYATDTKFGTSTLSNGGSGPLLAPSEPGRVSTVYVGSARIKTLAGTFDTEHFRVDLPKADESMKSWAMGADCIPVTQVHIWPDRPEKRFELVSLEDDYR